MPSEFPGRPKLQRGRLEVYDSQTMGTPPSALINFQYNPEQLRRTLANRTEPPKPGEVGGARDILAQVLGPPVETINLTVVLDAKDQVGVPTPEGTGEHGLHPALAMLELLLYPPSMRAEEIRSQAEEGAVQVLPADLPLTLFVWGHSRVVPVMLTSFTVTEEAFDSQLNPIEAKVDLGMRVLTYVEFPEKTIPRQAFIAYQQTKERLTQ